jgi:hypothetical protein
MAAKSCLAAPIPQSAACHKPEAGWRAAATSVNDLAMTSFLTSFALPIALIAVAIVLLLGLLNMMRGGSPNTSQRLMRLRVVLQFVAIVIAMLAIWAMGR